MIRTEDLTRLGVLAHPVGKLLDMTTGLQNLFRSQHGTIHLQHVLFQHEMLPPQVDHVVENGAPGRAIIVETGNTPIDLERGGVDKTSTEQRVQDGPVNDLAGLGREGCHCG